MRTYTREEQLCLWLHHATGAHALLFSQLMARYRTPLAVYELAQKGATSAFTQWGQAFAGKLCAMAKEEEVERHILWLKENKTEIVSLFSEQYPALLKEIRQPPAILYVRGQLPEEIPLPVAMVGMRKHTAYGEAVALHFGQELVKHGATVVSGMAAGIDSAAHVGALRCQEAEFPTLAVLGSGIDVIYPSNNARLYYEIIERGAVVSEFLPGTKPNRENFPIRNRVISGLCRGVVVVEAASRSGTTITANYALDQNRDLFAVPGRITDESSVGPNGLIQRGEAKPVFCAMDILCEYGVTGEAPKPVETPDITGLTETQLQVVDLLRKGEKSADEICELLSMSVSEVNSTLTSLQFSGIIKQLPGRVFGL